MNSTAKKLSSFEAQLESAKDKRQLERARLEQSAQELQHAQSVAENHSQRLQQAVSEEHAADIADVAKAASKRRDAEAMADAASRRVSDAQAKVTSCRDALKAAERDVELAADAILLCDAEAMAQQIIDLESKALALREQLLALRIENATVANSVPVMQACDGPGFFATSRYTPMVNENGPHQARISSHRVSHKTCRTELMAG